MDTLNIIKPIAIFEQFFNHKLRLDDRDCEEFADFNIHTDLIKTANGSAMVTLGNTKVVAGVKVKAISELSKPGQIVCVVELCGLSDRSTKVNAPPSKLAQALSSKLQRFVETVICPDAMEQLKIYSKSDDKNKQILVGSYVLHLDIIVLINDGCLFDACVPAALASLITAKWPRLESLLEDSNVTTDMQFARFCPSSNGAQMKLNISNLIIPVSFAIVPIPQSSSQLKLKDMPVICQPSARELAIWDVDAGLITITVDSLGNVCDMDFMNAFLSTLWKHVASENVLKKQDQVLNYALEMAVKHSEKIREMILKAVEKSA